VDTFRHSVADPDTKYFGKLDPDPHPYQSEKQDPDPDPDPHQSEKVEAFLSTILKHWKKRVQI
jgi:hypothetical protein